MKHVIKLFSANFLTALALMFTSSTSFAYPDFIGYGYRSCITCHFNSSGGGALNDYGRGVWASEIVSKAIFHRKTSDEKLSEYSGFLGKTQLPWWIRPGIKYRGLYLVRDPGSKNSIEQWINMQGEVNSAFFINKDQRIMLYASYGYRPLPQKYKNTPGDKPEEWITREHYVRVQYRDDLYLYAGLMDKVFGIKNVDHTAFARTKTQLTMDDQTHGVIAHLIKDSYELTGQVFAGNLQQKEKLRPQGFNFHFDKNVGEKTAWGVSYLSQKNDFAKRQMLSGQFRTGLRNPGNGFIGEVGFVEEKADNAKAITGMYTYVQNMNRIARGYHFLVKFETWKPDISTDASETFRYGLGLLSFPWSRTEFRVDVYNQRTVVPGQANEDTWIAASQIHLSF